MWFFAKIRDVTHCKTGLETDSYQIESYHVIMNIRVMTSTHLIEYLNENLLHFRILRNCFMK